MEIGVQKHPKLTWIYLQDMAMNWPIGEAMGPVRDPLCLDGNFRGTAATRLWGVDGWPRWAARSRPAGPRNFVFGDSVSPQPFPS
jgi:hypothetical protein